MQREHSAVLAIVLSLALLSISCAPSRPEVEVSFHPIGRTLQATAAEATGLVKPMARTTEEGVSYLTTPMGEVQGKPTAEDTDDGGKAVFTFDLPTAGTCTVLAKVYWHNGASNSFWVRVDDSPWQRLGNAGDENKWIHIQGPSWKLAAGKHTVTIREREWGARIATVYLSPMPQYISHATQFADGRFVAEKSRVLVYPSYSISPHPEGQTFRACHILGGRAGVLADRSPLPVTVVDSADRQVFRGTLPPGYEARVAVRAPRAESYRVQIGRKSATWQWLFLRFNDILDAIQDLPVQASGSPTDEYSLHALFLYSENIKRGYRFDEPAERILHAGEYVTEQLELAEQILKPLRAGKLVPIRGLRPQLARLEKPVHADTRYWLFLPKGYDPDATKKWPTILSLHGAGGRGTNIERIKSPLHHYAEAHKDFPFIIISPQCPKDSWWSAPPGIEQIKAFMADALPKYRIDPDRLYLAGSSMGGYGTWTLAAEMPEKFAALVPICGGGDPKNAAKIKHIPTWVFHGDSDTAVPLARSQQMVDALKKLGADVKLTIYPDTGHDAWTPTYQNPKLYEWLLTQRRKKPETP